MKKLVTIIISLILSLLVFKSIDERVYSGRTPLLESLEILRGNVEDEYIFIFKLNQEVDQKEVQGARMFIHGTPVKDQLGSLPEGRRQYGFDNWGFTVNIHENNTFTRKVKSKVDEYENISIGLFIKPGGERIKNLSTLFLGGVSLESEVKSGNRLKIFSKRELKNLKSYNFSGILVEKGVMIYSLLFLVIFLVINIIVDNYSLNLKNINKNTDILEIMEALVVVTAPIFIMKRGGAFNEYIKLVAIIVIIKIVINRYIELKSSKVLVLGVLSFLLFTAASLGKFSLDTREELMNYLNFIIVLLLFSQLTLKKETIKVMGFLAVLSLYMPIVQGLEEWAQNGYGYMRVSGGYDISSYVTLLLVGNLVCLKSLLIKGIGIKYRVLLIITHSLSLVALLISGTKMMWLSIFLLSLLVLLSFNRSYALILKGGVIALFLFSLNEFSGNRYIQRMANTFDLEVSSNKARVYMWKEAFEQWKGSPLTGVGYANYGKEARARHPEFKEFVDENNKRVGSKFNEGLKSGLLVGEDKERIHAYYEREHSHNNFFEILCTTGIAGIVGYVLYIFAIFVTILRKYLAEGNDLNKAFLLITLLSILFLQIYGLSDATIYMRHVNLIQSIMVGLSLSLTGNTYRRITGGKECLES